MDWMIEAAGLDCLVNLGGGLCSGRLSADLMMMMASFIV